MFNPEDNAIETLASLEEKLRLAEAAEFSISMSDNFAYTSGRIEPYKRRIRELRAKIEVLNHESDDVP